MLVSGSPPIRAKKLRYYTDPNFRDRILPAPILPDGPYADCPKARADDWAKRVAITDLRLAGGDESQSEADPGGLEQQRHPALGEEAVKQPDSKEQAAQIDVGDDGDSLVQDATALDRARLPVLDRGHGLNESSGRDLLPGF